MIVTMPAGEYWIGDLCYVMHEDWDEFCMAEDPGLYTLKDGTHYAWHYTAYGDGSYEDNYGNSYGVDAGLIGMINVADIDMSNPENHMGLGHVFKFEKNVIFSYNEGIFEFNDGVTRVIIDTDSSYDNDYDDWED